MRESDIVNKQIFDAMIGDDKTSEGDLDNEMQSTDEYRRKFEDAKVKVWGIRDWNGNSTVVPGIGGSPSPRQRTTGDSTTNYRKYKGAKL